MSRAEPHSVFADGVYVMNVSIRIDLDRCTGCKMCVSSCSYGVLEWFDDGPVVANPHECAACLDCERSCEVGAITVEVS